jgi:hypothetical protein
MGATLESSKSWKFLYNKICMLGERAFNIALTIAGDHDGRHGTAWPSGKAGDVEKRLPFSCRVVFALCNSRNLSLQMASDSPMPLTTSYEINVTV